MTYRALGFVVAACAFGIDQISKGIALATTSLQAGIEVFPFFNFVLVRNYGVSFGLFAGEAHWGALASIGIAMAIGLSIWMWRSQRKLQVIGIGLLIGGALGNVLDRFRHGAVIDFLGFRPVGSGWPAFNLADVAIVCGAGLLIIESLRSESRPQSGLGGPKNSETEEG
ncbi:MAG: hypothetical protein APF80_17560 [Alphaproteobacteria bacterium BRH_c36]|nr:MAG: hypothetical protein APF80_17560 [Alphaproteobacteria bacterium BRH_c36]